MAFLRVQRIDEVVIAGLVGIGASLVGKDVGVGPRSGVVNAMRSRDAITQPSGGQNNL